MTEERYDEICDRLHDIIKGTEYEGHLYAVGGCVRDIVKHRNDFQFMCGESEPIEIKDVDLVVDLPDGGIRFANWLYDNRYTKGSIVIYETYGTAMFKLKEFPDEPLEIVQTRKEQYKDKNSRNPETCYGTIEEDCTRRDLTINALYYDITKKEILDLVGGVIDIENCIIRTPTEPQIVFDDDPLRMLRVIRFSARYGWDIEYHTLESIKKNAERIKIITQERINDEILKTFKTALSPYSVLMQYYNTGLLEYILPELYEFVNRSNPETVLHRMSNMIGYNKGEDWLYASLFYWMPVDEMRQMLRRMKHSNDVVCGAAELVEFLQYSKREDYLNPKGIRKLQHKYGRIKMARNRQFMNRYEYNCDDTYFAHSDIIFKISGYLDATNSTMYEYKLPVDGFDLLRLGYNGQEIGEALDIALDYAYETPSITKEEILEMLKIR